MKIKQFIDEFGRRLSELYGPQIDKLGIISEEQKPHSQLLLEGTQQLVIEGGEQRLLLEAGTTQAPQSQEPAQQRPVRQSTTLFGPSPVVIAARDSWKIQLSNLLHNNITKLVTVLSRELNELHDKAIVLTISGQGPNQDSYTAKGRIIDEMRQAIDQDLCVVLRQKADEAWAEPQCQGTFGAWFGQEFQTTLATWKEDSVKNRDILLEQYFPPAKSLLGELLDKTLSKYVGEARYFSYLRRVAGANATEVVDSQLAGKLARRIPALQDFKNLLREIDPKINTKITNVRSLTRAFREAAKKVHPDKNLQADKNLQGIRQFKLLDELYKGLCDSEKLQRIDRIQDSLHADEPVVTPGFGLSVE
jgi:hypothetical protein